MSFYGLLILQKTNFKLTSKLFVTAKKQTSNCLSVFLSNPKDWYVIAWSVYVITEGVLLQSFALITYISFEMITYATFVAITFRLATDYIQRQSR